MRQVNRDHRRAWWLAIAWRVIAALGSLVALITQAVFSTGVDLGADTTATHLRLLVFSFGLVAVLVGIGYALAGQIDKQFQIITAYADQLGAAAGDAWAARRGLWGACES